MKVRITMFNIKGKVDIWWEDVKNVIIIQGEGLTWMEFEIPFKERYLCERYYDDKAKEVYDLKMGFMADEDYIRILLGLLRYVSYLKDEKDKIERFISGLLVVFKDRIDLNNHISLEEAIRKLKNYYEQSKCNT